MNSYFLMVLLYSSIGVNCAVNSRAHRDISDLQPMATVIKLDDLHPQNEGISSSFTIVQTAGRSRPLTGINPRNHRQPELKDDENTYSFDTEDRSNKPRAVINRQNHRQLKLEDDRDDDDDKVLVNKIIKNSDKLLRLSHSESAPPPQSINEIVEKIRPTTNSVKNPSGSNDLKKSGTLLGRDLDDDFEGGYDAEKHYNKEDNGAKFIEAHQSKAGENDKKDYSRVEDFDKQQNRKHGLEEKKGVVSAKEGKTNGHREEKKHFGEEFQEQEGEKGVSVRKKGGHKKGRKKTGFHKVHRKDEFKKDEVFYDESHDGEEEEEHAHEQEKHVKKKGGTAKKASADSGYQAKHAEKQAAQNKGEKYDEASGYNKEIDKEQQENEHAEFQKKGGNKQDEKYSHSVSGGSDVLF